MRVLICGNCSWDDAKPIFDLEYEYCQKYGAERLTFISGMAHGADYIAYVCTFALGVECDEYPWDDEGRAKAKAVARRKGVEAHKSSRNQWMLDSGVDVCHAFAENLPGPWSGTRDMVNRCLKAGVPCFWHNGTDVYKILSDDRTTHDMEYVAVTMESALDATGWEH